METILCFYNYMITSKTFNYFPDFTIQHLSIILIRVFSKSGRNNFKELFKKSHIYGIIRNSQNPTTLSLSFQLMFEKRLISVIRFFL